MTERRTRLSREMPCPVCGYDLRGAARVAGARCSECGTEIQAGRVASRIPWTHRRELGRVRAYLATVWMVLRRPGMLAAEVDRPVVLRDARKFYWVSVVLATVIATAMMGGVFMIANDRDSELPHVADSSFWIIPAFVLTDRWFALVLLALGLCFGMRVSLVCYREVLGWGMKKGVERGRLKRMALYLAGWMPVEALLCGLMYLGSVTLVQDWDWVVDWKSWILIAMVLLGAMAMQVFLVPSMVMISRHGRLKMLRRILMAIVFPAIALSVMAGALLAAFWTCGYLAMAVRSMTH